MHGFEQKDLVVTAPQYRIWRQPGLVGMEVLGRIDDAGSEAWRSALAAELERRGWPPFYCMDVTTIEPDNSMAMRYRTALFIRDTAKRLRWAAVLTRSNSGPLIAARTILRIAGVGNISIHADEPSFRLALDDMRAGRKPARLPRENPLDIKA